MYRVLDVTTDTINVPEEHKHITSVRCILANGRPEAAGSKLLVSEEGPEVENLSVGEIYERMQAGEGFWVRYDDGKDRWLHVHGCPACDTYPYLCDDTTMLPDEEEHT